MSNLPEKTQSQNRLPTVKAPNPLARFGWAAGSTAVALAGGYAYLYVNTLVGLVLLVIGFISALRAIPRGKSGLEDGAGETTPDDGVKKSLGRCRFLEHIGNRGERAYDQYSQAVIRHKKLVALLGEKFSPEEITYGRYLGAIEQAHFGLMASFEKVASHLQGAAATDPGALKQRLKELTTASSAPNDERAALEERLRVREEQLTSADEILGFNEKALLELDRITSALSAIETRRGPNGGVELSAALADLEELSKRAQKYSIK